MRFSFTVTLLAGVAFAAPPLHVQQRPAFRGVPALSIGEWSSIQSTIGKALGAMKGCMGWMVENVEEEAEVVEKKNVYEVLSQDETFSKLVTLINLDADAVHYMSDPKESFTLFAPSNDGFPTPGGHEMPRGFGDPTSLNTLYRYFLKYPTDEEDDNEKRRKVALHILHGVLQYHILSTAPYASTALAENQTAATDLTLPAGTLLSTPQRIRLSTALRPLPTLELNFRAYVTKPDITASNGVVHAIDRPLSIPLSVFEGLFELPAIFSVSSGAIAKTGLGPILDWKPHFSHDKDGVVDYASMIDMEWHGSPAVTVFAPTNAAWAKLPPKLSHFLLSPWGERALSKVLAFHVVNDTVLHADFLRTGSDKDDSSLTSVPPTYELDLSLPTLLGKNHTLPIHISKSKPTLPIPGTTKYTISVQGQDVEVADGVARNGVVHAVGSLLNPLEGHHGRHHGEGEDMWVGWEEWLVEWVERD